MTITEKDFMLEFNDANSRFDLYLLQVVNAKDETKRREEFKLEGYGMSLENCFRHIINYRINNKHDVLSLKEYVAAYTKEKRELESLIKESLHGGQ